MRIRILKSDGRVFEGTPVQIIEAMQYIAFGQEDRTLGEYIDWLIKQIGFLNSIDIRLEGETDEERAASMVRAMLDLGLAEEF